MRKLDIYTDGSFDRQTDRCTGAYIAIEDDKVLFCGKVILEKQMYKESWNVSAELMTVLVAVTRTAQIFEDIEAEITVVHDYIGVSSYVSGDRPWKAKKQIPVIYTMGINKFREENKNIHIGFRKVKGHSGDKYNDMVDRLANGITTVSCHGKMLPDTIL